MKINKNFTFWLILFCTLFSFVFSIKSFLLKNENAYPLFSNTFNKINVIIKSKTNPEKNFIVKADNSLLFFDSTKKPSNLQISNRVQKINILANKNSINHVELIVLYNGLKTFVYKDFKAFEQKEDLKLCFDKENCITYSNFEVPKEIKSNNNSKFLNFTSNKELLLNALLSPFSGSNKMFFSYVLFFFLIFYYKKYEKEIKTINFPKQITTFLIFIFGLLMYTNGLLSYLPWEDEYATLDFIDSKNSFLKTFMDPGNPPLFYILYRLHVAIFHSSMLSFKIFPCFLMFLSCVLLWLFLKKNFNQKTANLGAFLAFLNVPMVYFAQEMRCYCLCALFSVLFIIIIFKIINSSSKNSYFICYALLCALASNVHYFEILLIFSNFLFISIIFIKEKRYNDILKLFLSSFIGILFFVPYFCLTSLNQALLDKNFNLWIPQTSYFQIKKCIYYLFGGGVSFLFSNLFFLKFLIKPDFKDKKRNILIIYSFSTIIFVIASSVFLSFLIRPMLVERYLLLLSPIFIVFLSLVFTSKYKNKYLCLVFVFWFLALQANSFEKNIRKKESLELPLNFSFEYYKNVEKKNIYVILKTFKKPKSFFGKEKFLEKNVNYVFCENSKTEKEIENIFEKDKNAKVFASISNSNSNLKSPRKFSQKMKNDKKYECYFNSTSDMCLWKIEKN